MIQCRQVWVQYRRNVRLRHLLKKAALRLFNDEMETVDFWGLKNVSFEVGKGEVMGVVGVNGSGKSTLLKVLGGVLKPDRGTVETLGRVCPLLEVGTGFAPELSGRDNIFLNGAVLGIRKNDLKTCYDKIVEYTELEDFIDSPLKHYSTGMRMRLGFAIAMHAEPDVLLVDEVLAVGDASFQKKCIDSIAALRSQGVTILFVSHAMDTVKHLCTSALWLDHGELKAQGRVDDVVEAYFKDNDRRDKERMENKSNLPASEELTLEKIVRIDRVEFLDKDRHSIERYQPLDEMIAAIHFTANEKIADPIFGVGIHRADGVHICGPNTGECEYRLDFIDGKGVMEFRVPSLKLLSGIYYMTVGIFDASHIHAYDYRDRVFRFEIEYSAMKGHRGLVAMDYEWNLRY